MLLVIGATGHTGKYFLQELRKNNYKEKIRFMIRNSVDEKIFKENDLNYEIVYGNLDNEEDIVRACEGIDTILEIYNIRYSLNVLEAAIKEKVRRIIFVHTTGIYSKYKMASEEYKNIENDVIEKADGKVNITILRPTMIYGDICDYNISKFIKMMDKMRIYPLIAGGRAKIQPVNAMDLGKAYYQVLMNEEKTSNKYYNLSGDEPITIKNMLKSILKYLDKKSIFISIPLWLSTFCAYILRFITFGKINIVEKVLRMDEDRCFDNSEAKKDFGYDTIKFQDGLKEEVEQYKRQKNSNKEKKAIILSTVPSTIEQFNMQNIKLLKELGYKVEVASNFNEIGNIDNNQFNILLDELRQLDVKIHSIPFSRNLVNFSNIKAYYQLKKLMKKEIYQLVHCHTPICGVITRLVARKKRKKGLNVIYTAHGFHFYKGAPLINWLIYYPIEKICSKWTDCLITINKEDYEFAKKKFKIKKIELVNGVGVNENKFSTKISEEEKQKIKNSIGLKDNDFTIIQIGELNANKNQIMTIEAVKNISQENKDVKLLLVGKGKLQEYYKQKIGEYNLQQQVKLLGYRNDIVQLLNISDCLVSTSRREGLPVNVIEAMMSGIYIIGTKCRGTVDLLPDSQLIAIDDFRGLENKLRELIKKGRAKIKTNYDIKKYTELQILKEMKKIYNYF